MHVRPLRRKVRVFAVLASALALGLAISVPASAWPFGDRTPPSTPGNFRVVSVGQTTATLSWSPSTDNRAVDRYTVVAHGVYGSGSIVKHPGTSTTLTGLPSGSTFTFTVRAYDTSGNQSSDASTTGTTAVDPALPTTPSNLQVVSITHASATIAWDPSTDADGIDGYLAWRANDPGHLFWVDHPATSVLVQPLEPNLTQTLSVRAKDNAGNYSNIANISVTTPPNTGEPDTTPPSTPANVRVVGVTASTVHLQWNSSLDTISQVKYDVLVNGVPTPNALSEVAAGTFPRPSGSGADVRQLDPGTSYQFTVRARDTAGNLSGPSNTVSATTGPGSGDTVAPTTPTLTSADDGGDGSCPAELHLNGTPSTDNSGFVQYEIRVSGTIIDVASAPRWITYTEALGIHPVTLVAVDRDGNASAPSSPRNVNIRYNPCPT